MHSGDSFETILSFDFCTESKILIHCSLIKHFSNKHKIYSSQLQVSILHRVAPIKVYLNIFDSHKNSYLENAFVPIIVISQTQPKGCLIWQRHTALGLKLVYRFVNFIIPSPATYKRHSRGNYQTAKAFAEANTENC